MAELFDRLAWNITAQQRSESLHSSTHASVFLCTGSIGDEETLTADSDGNNRNGIGLRPGAETREDSSLQFLSRIAQQPFCNLPTRLTSEELLSLCACVFRLLRHGREAAERITAPLH